MNLAGVQDAIFLGIRDFAGYFTRGFHRRDRREVLVLSVTGRFRLWLVQMDHEKFEKDELRGDWPFREVVGSMTWLANHTRPDISNAVRDEARHAHAPKSVRWGGNVEYFHVLEDRE